MKSGKMLLRLLKKLGVFLLAFVLALVFFFAFEPYDYWHLRGESWYNSRYMAGMRELMMTDPTHILLGDSRMANMNVDYIEQVSGTRYCNLAYGGATFSESIAQFWFAVDHTSALEQVVISADFYTLNGYNTGGERINSVIEKAENPVKFVMEHEYWVGAFDNFAKQCKNLWADISGDESLRWEDNDPSSLDHVEQPRDLEEYAATVKSNIAESMGGYGQVFVYVDALLEIASYCSANDIELVIWIPNCNRVMWDEIIYPMEIDSYIGYYKDQLKSVATVYDGEFYNSYAKDDANFLDGLHFTKAEKMHMARVLFAGEPSEYYLITTPAQYLAGDYELTSETQLYPPEEVELAPLDSLAA